VNGRRPGVLRARRVAAAGAVALVVLTTMLGPAARAGAEDRPSVVPGQAKARAEGFSVKIQVAGSFADGGVSLGIVQGVAAADSHDTVGAAEGRAIDYGLVDALNRLPTAACPNVVPLFDPATLPPITRADSDQPDGATPRPTRVRYAGWPTAGEEAGIQDAVAGPSATGTGSTRTPYVDGGFLQAYDVVTEARGTVGPDGRREAVATVTAARLDLFGGLVSFLRPRFSARSATGSTGGGSFSYDSVAILGNYRAPDAAAADLAAVTGAVEGFLGFLGLHVDWPTVDVVRDDAPGGGATSVERVVVSPLRLRLSNLPIGRDVIGPLLAAFGPTIDEALDAYLADPCANQSLRLIVDVARGFVSGTGEAGVSFGGVEVETNDRWVAPAVLFDPVVPLSEPPPAAPVAAPSVLADLTVRPSAPIASAPVPAAVPALVPTAPVVGAVVASAPEVAAPRRSVALVPVTSRRREAGRTGGAAVWAGLVAAALIAALAVADRRTIGASRRSTT